MNHSKHRQKEISTKPFSEIVIGVAVVLLSVMVTIRADSSQLSKEGFSRLQEQAKSRSPTAMLALGKAYRDGMLVTRNYTTAAQWYRMAAEAGNAEAGLLLGLCYSSGIGVAKSTRDAIFWLQRSSDLGNIDAQFYLGLLFESVEMENEALALWLKAANAGHVAAQTKAGFALLESTSFGWENQRNGVDWLKRRPNGMTLRLNGDWASFSMKASTFPKIGTWRSNGTAKAQNMETEMLELDCLRWVQATFLRGIS